MYKIAPGPLFFIYYVLGAVRCFGIASGAVQLEKSSGGEGVGVFPPFSKAERDSNLVRILVGTKM